MALAKEALPRRPKLDEVIRIPVTPEDKRRVYEVAAQRGLSVSEMVRRAIDSDLPHQAA